MKKNLVILSILVIAGIAILSNQIEDLNRPASIKSAEAYTISWDQFLSFGDISVARMNTPVNTIMNWANGAVEDVNLARQTLTQGVFADSANPRVRDSELLGDFTYTGMLPPTSASLTATTTAGTSYVGGYRIVTSATSKTYTASKDTWVYIDQNGAFQYVEVANGAAQPTTPANSLLLAKVVTSGAAVTSVTDQRQLTPPNLRIYVDYRSGLNCVYNSANVISVGPGEIEFSIAASSGRRRNTSSLTATMATDLDTGAEGASTMYYVWAYPDTTNNNNFAVKLSASSSDATGITNERLIGYAYNDASSNFNSYGSSNIGGNQGGNSRNMVAVHSDASDVFTGVAIGRLTGTSLDVNCVGARPVLIEFTAGMKSSGVGQGQDFWINLDGTDVPGSLRQTFTESTTRNGTAAIIYSVPTGLGPGFHHIAISTAASNGAWTNTVMSRDLVFQEN